MRLDPKAEKEVCIDCGEGFNCVGMEDILIAKGYMADVVKSGEDFWIYKCHGNPLRCKGGLAGETCAAGRTGIACAQCKPMMTPSADGSECIPCGGSDIFPFMLTCVSVVAALTGMYVFLDLKDHAKQNPWLLLCGMIFGITITSLQQLSVVVTMSVEWPEPLRSAFTILRLLAIDVEVLRMGCVASASPLGVFLLKLAILGSGLAGLLLIHVILVLALHGGRFTERMPSLVGSLGTIVLIVYISVTAAVIEPLRCKNNPNSQMTVSTYQSVVCWETQDHWTMVITGLVALMLPLGYLGHCIATVIQ
jgi:hypothetical protein